MPAFRIAVIGGDGIGPEVIDQAIRVADAALRHEAGAVLEWNRLPWSGDHYLKVGWMLPTDGWDILKKHDTADHSLGQMPLFGRDAYNVSVYAFARDFEKRHDQLYPQAAAKLDVLRR